MAKLVTAALVGAVGGAVIFGLDLAIALPVYAARGVHHLPVDVASLWIGTTLLTACFGLLGVALGALTRNTVAAIIGALVWAAVIELAVLQPLFPSLAKWLPTGAAVSLTTATDHSALLRHRSLALRPRRLGRRSSRCSPPASPSAENFDEPVERHTVQRKEGTIMNHPPPPACRSAATATVQPGSPPGVLATDRLTRAAADGTASPTIPAVLQFGVQFSPHNVIDVPPPANADG